MTIAAGVAKQLRYKVEATFGTAPGASGAQVLRRVNSNLDLSKDTYQSAEIRTDYQIADMRHGVRRVGGNIKGEISPGTYKDFMTMAMKGREYGKNSQKMAGNEQIAAEVGSNPNGIGYIGYAYAGAKGVKIVSIGGSAPNPAAVKDYVLSRPVFLYTNGEPAGNVKSFIDFCLSPAGTAVIAKGGFVAVK